jgi:hypothetical protein
MNAGQELQHNVVVGGQWIVGGAQANLCAFSPFAAPLAWTDLPPLPCPPIGHSCLAGWQSSVYVLLAYDNAYPHMRDTARQPRCFVLDMHVPGTGVGGGSAWGWRDLSAMPTPYGHVVRLYATALTTSVGILVLGGIADDDMGWWKGGGVHRLRTTRPVRRIDVYHPDSNSWSVAALELPSAILTADNISATLVDGHQIFVFASGAGLCKKEQSACWSIEVDALVPRAVGVDGGTPTSRSAVLPGWTRHRNVRGIVHASNTTAL